MATSKHSPSRSYRVLLTRGVCLVSSLGLLGNLYAPASAQEKKFAPAEPAPQPSYQGLPADAVFEAPKAPTPIAPPEASPPSPQHSYIDTTDYSVGATDLYEAPATVEFVGPDGCGYTQAGRGAPTDLCPPAAPAPAQQLPPAPSVAGDRAPTNNATAGTPLPPVPATNTTIQPVRVGPVEVGSGGPRITTTASSQAYYEQRANEDAQAARTLRDRALFRGRPGNGNTSIIFPLSIPAPITSAFGWRTHPVHGGRRMHTGTDIGAPMGTSVVAALAGRVAIAEALGGYGLTVVLQHEEGTIETLYAHLSEILVRPGEKIEQGEVIGLVGSTGVSTGPHLHFEIRELTADGWRHLDPGEQLEYALIQLVENLRRADADVEGKNWRS